MGHSPRTMPSCRRHSKASGRRRCRSFRLVEQGTSRSRGNAFSFTHCPPRASSSASSVSCCSGAPSGSSAGKYRPAGARNRPAACKRGIPAARSSSSTSPPGDPASRTRHTPQAAHAVSRSSASAPPSATGPPTAPPTVGWAWASTRPGMTYRPGSRSAAGTGSLVRHPASSTHRSAGRSPSGNGTACTDHDIPPVSIPTPPAPDPACTSGVAPCRR